MDEAGKIVRTNCKLQDWLGLKEADLAGKRTVQIFSVASRIVFETSIRPLLSLKGKVDGASLDLKGVGTGNIPVILSAETSSLGGQPVTIFVFILANARRNFERELAKARAEAEAQLLATQREGELREQFVAILGHDLRNPLASISSAMNILSREPLSQRGKQILALTEGSVQRMALLIDNVLDFARTRLGGGLDIYISDERSLEHEIRQVVSELSTANPTREIRVEFSDHIAVPCDVTRVGQVLSNLLGNALAYGNEDQPIEVSSGTTGEGWFELSVSNHGAPISSTAMKFLFDPFARHSKDANKKGLGLGLYIALEIAKAHDGEIDVVSDETLTTFTLRIPLDRSGYH